MSQNKQSSEGIRKQRRTNRYRRVPSSSSYHQAIYSLKIIIYALSCCQLISAANGGGTVSEPVVDLGYIETRIIEVANTITPPEANPHYPPDIQKRRLQSLENIEENVSFQNKKEINTGIETTSAGDGEELSVVSVTFEDILLLTLFIAAAWIMSNLSLAIGLPGLVGEIVCGFLLGPPLANMCPFPQAMVLIGNFGLLGLMLESGIHLDVAQLRETGTRAVLMAMTGALLALFSGIGFGYSPLLSEDRSFATAMAVGSSFAPSSLGVAAAVLSTGQVLNTPIGQLIVASSVVDDVLGLILLAILNVFVMEGEPTAWNYIQPFLASFGFLAVFGYLGITWIPHCIQYSILPRVRPASREKATFGIMFLLMLIYLPVMNYSGASYLTGAFLAGLSVSQLPSIHASYEKNGRELMVWLMRIFFTATIGFQVPILQYNDWEILKWSAIFLIPVVAKMPLGLLVPRFHRKDKAKIPTDFPFDPFWRDAVITSLSVMCRGEFNFVVASFGLSSGLLNSDVYSAIVMAVLLSSILGPLLLSRAIKMYNSLAQDYINTPHTINRVNKSSKDGYRPLFIAIQVRTPTSWGLHEKFQHVLEDLDLLVLDHRTWHTNSIQSVAMSEIFVQDTIQAVRISNCFGEDSENENDDRDDAQSVGSLITSTMGSRDIKSNGTLSPTMSRASSYGILNEILLHDVEEGVILNTDEMDTSRFHDSARSKGSLIEPTGAKICSTEDSIQLRLDQVKDALEACLEGVDGRNYAIKTTQWEPFIQEVIDEKGHQRQRTYTFGESQDIFSENILHNENENMQMQVGADDFLENLFDGYPEDLGLDISIPFTPASNADEAHAFPVREHAENEDDLNAIPSDVKISVSTQDACPRDERQEHFLEKPLSVQIITTPDKLVDAQDGEVVHNSAPSPAILSSQSRPVTLRHRVKSLGERRISFSPPGGVQQSTPGLSQRPLTASNSKPPRPPSMKSRAATTGHQPRSSPTNSAIEKPLHRRSPSNCEGQLKHDLWESDAVAHKCVRPGTCIFQPTVSGITAENSAINEQWLAMANKTPSDIGLSDDEGTEEDFLDNNNFNTTPTGSVANSLGHGHRRHVSADFSEEQETTTIHNLLHGYIRH